VLAARSGDPAACSRLVEVFEPMIGGIARGYASSARVARAELMQDGVVGLLRALHRYDPKLGTPFWPYASWWVRQAMQQLVAQMTRPIVLSDRALRRLARIKHARRELLQSTEREPTAAELAEATGLTRAQVDSLLAAERMPRGLEEPIGDGEPAPSTVGEMVADPVAEDAYDRVDQRIEVESLRALAGGLAARERGIVFSHYGLAGPARTLREIAVELQLSVERVRQIEDRALGKLREASVASVA
jgi:RNA polymerase sigma factor (sigma-70 family)